MSRKIRIALYGDVNLNIIDGSSIWLQSMATVLSRFEENHVTVVLKATEERDLLTRPIRELPRVRVVNPVDAGWVTAHEMSRNQALDSLERLDREEPFDAFLLRGFWLNHSAATRKARPMHGRLWPYLTDIPQSRDELTEEALARLTAIADASRFIPCQTELLRAFVESYVPGFAHKAILLPPMIPDEVPAHAGDPEPIPEGEPLRLGYVGKHAPLWNTLEMTEVVRDLRQRGAHLELEMVGDKIHNPKSHPGFYDRMRDALENTDGVHWHSGKSRAEALSLVSRFHIALGWRAAALDDSRELSTKLLEYGAVGTPAIVNRNPLHEELLGADYPLFANERDELEQLVLAAREPAMRSLARDRCRAAAERFTFSSVAAQLQPFLRRAAPEAPGPRRASKLKVLVACHDFKFFTRIQDHLAALEDVELRVDAWRAIAEHDESQSERLLAWADVVICEWCTNNAIWYSQRVRPEQRLIIRLHRFELYRRYPREVVFENVDRVVFVGGYYRDEAIETLGWPREKLVVIPNWVDTRMFDRPKVFGALFNLGMIGIAPRRKRLDRALDVLARVRAVEPRFRLHVKTKQAWLYPWIWSDPEEREHFRENFRRSNTDARLRGAVQYDAFGPDVAAWLRKIGFVLSTSDDESFHLAPAEGMASGALPMLLPWAGADKLYDGEWIHADEQAMAEWLLETVRDGSWEKKAARARGQITERYSVEAVGEAWARLVLGI